MVAWSDSGKLLERYKNLKCKKACFYGDQNAGMKIPAYLDGIEKNDFKKQGQLRENFLSRPLTEFNRARRGRKVFFEIKFFSLLAPP